MHTAVHLVALRIDRDSFHTRLGERGGFRENGDERAAAQQVKDDIDIVDLHHDFEVVVTPLQQVLEGVARLQALVGQDEIIAFKVSEGDALLPCQRVVVIDDGRQAIAKNRSAVYRLVPLERLEGQHKIQFALLQSVHQFLHGTIDDVELDVGVGMDERDERLGHDVAKGERHSDVEFSSQHLTQVIHVVSTGPGRIDRLLGVGQQFFSRLREIHLVGIALKERHSYLLLQMGNLLRQGTLRDVELPRRLGEIKRFGHLEEIFQLSDFHSYRSKSVCKDTTRVSIRAYRGHDFSPFLSFCVHPLSLLRHGA